MQTYTARNPDPSFPYPPQYWFPPFFTIQPNSTTRLAQFRAWSDLIQAYCRHHRIFKIAVVDAAAMATATGMATAATTTTAAATSAASTATGTSGRVREAYAGWPLFHNREIARRLDIRGISEVLRWMNNKGAGAGAGGDKGDKGAGGAEGEGMGGGGDVGVGGGGRAERLEGEKETGEGGTYWIYWRTPEEWAGVLMDWIERTGQRGSVLTLYEIAEGEASMSEGWFLFPFLLKIFAWIPRLWD